MDFGLIGFIQGKVNCRGREPSIVVSNLLTLEEAEREFTRQLAIKFRHGVHSRDDMDRTREVLGRHPGRVEVVVIVETSNRDNDDDGPVRYVMTTPSDLRVTCSRELQEELATVLGHGDFEFHGGHSRTGDTIRSGHH